MPKVSTVNSDNHTHEVAGKLPNEYGLYDMAGNVWEFCNDYDDMNYYLYSESLNPRGPKDGDLRILRGGGWLSGTSALRSADRLAARPGDRYTSANTFGLRCVHPIR